MSSLAQGSLFVPYCNTEGIYHHEGNGDLIGSLDNLNQSELKPNEDAICSVLQFGSIIPPLSPWKGIKRLIPGYEYQGTNLLGPRIVTPSRSHVLTERDVQIKRLENVVDKSILRRLESGLKPVVLFSGGVDSGFIANRLAILGVKDCLLINYSFKQDDPESLLAEQMANHLELPFERVMASKNLCDCLESPGKYYPQPFSDQSTVPTFELAQATIQRLKEEGPCLILDGTGADGAFGMRNRIDRWKKVYRVPSLFRSLCSRFYKSYLWRQTNAIEHYFRIIRRSKQMPLLSAVLAQNSLGGLFYADHAMTMLDELLSEWVSGWAGSSLPSQIVAADLSMVCANVFAQKSCSILTRENHEILYPFMEDDLITFALTPAIFENRNEPKDLMKESLARNIPSKMVYRPKSGFTDPKSLVFYNPQFVDYLRSSIDQSSPTASLLNPKYIHKAIDLLNKKLLLPAQTLNCLWAITFTDRWYRTT